MSNPQHIAIIDDEAAIRTLLSITLQSNGYRVSEAANASDGAILVANHPPDLVLLDLGLPDKSGFDVLTELRDWYRNPIIILSVRSDEEGIVRALDHGANDYLPKPFRTGELLARIRSVLRTTRQHDTGQIVTCSDLQIDLKLRTVKKAGLPVRLTSTEYDLLSQLASNEGKVLTHYHLLTQVWGPSFSTQTQYLRVFIAQLRKKLEDNPNQPKLIITEPGVGYRFVVSE